MNRPGDGVLCDATLKRRDGDPQVRDLWAKTLVESPCQRVSGTIRGKTTGLGGERPKTTGHELSFRNGRLLGNQVLAPQPLGGDRMGAT
jgi:hypothetical protein